MRGLYLGVVIGLWAAPLLAQGAAEQLLAPAQQITALAANPHSPNLLLGGTFNGGLFRTTDGGEGWEAIWAPGGGITNGYVSAIQFDPHRASTVYLTINNFNNPGVEGGALKSDDGGVTWQNISRGQVHSVSRALAVDPVLANGVYVGGFGAIFRSFDGGASWEEIPFDDNPSQVMSIAVHPLTQEIYAAVGNCSCDSRLYKSGDKGATWAEITAGLPLGEIIVIDLVLDPEDLQKLYAATTDGVFKSVDGGSNWQPIGLQDGWVRALTLDPRDPQILYAGLGAKALLPAGVMVSRDGGESWSRLFFGQPSALVVDLRQFDALYASLWFDVAEQGIYRLRPGTAATAVEEVGWGLLKGQFFR